MELRIQPMADTAYTYTIIYGEDKVAGARNYIIVPGPDGAHHWVCDEKKTRSFSTGITSGIFTRVFSLSRELISCLQWNIETIIWCTPSRVVRPKLSGKPAAKNTKAREFQ
jgi:hypothetical protein